MWKDDNPDAGIMSSQNRDWRDIFNANCFIGCFVDSFEPRGESEFKSKVLIVSVDVAKTLLNRAEGSSRIHQD